MDDFLGRVNTMAPKHESMKSTWRSADRAEWNINQRIIDALGIYPTPQSEIPTRSANEKVPFLPQWSSQLWILCHAAVPMALESLWSECNGRQRLGYMGVTCLYFVAFQLIVVRELQAIRYLGKQHGFFDGHHVRDGVPDHSVARVVQSLVKTAALRIGLAVWLCFDPGQPPPHIMMGSWKWWVVLPLKTGLYGIILDFWFYWYHRLMHEVPWLWQFHRTHHLTKHPNSLLSSFADAEQELFDMAVVPAVAFLTLRWLPGLRLLEFGLYEWWISHLYAAFTETFGHSGVRIHLTAPTTLSWLLFLVDAELTAEDHDLHHRKGWRRSFNYGKQSRLWDRCFGTCCERLESTDTNIDLENQVRMPIF